MSFLTLFNRNKPVLCAFEDAQMILTRSNKKSISGGDDIYFNFNISFVDRSGTPVYFDRTFRIEVTTKPYVHSNIILKGMSALIKPSGKSPTASFSYHSSSIRDYDFIRVTAFEKRHLRTGHQIDMKPTALPVKVIKKTGRLTI